MAELQAFHDALFPVAISFGATGGPEHRNEIITLTSGAEKRNARFSGSRRKYDAGTGLRSLNDLYQLIAFFEARRGSLHAFRFRDPFDMKSCGPAETPGAFDQRIGTGDGQTRTFSLVKNYGSGDDIHVRPISKPVTGSVLIAVSGSELQIGSDFEADHLSGKITFATPPQPEAAITAGYVFDVPVRFDTPQISASLASFKAGQIPAIPLTEVLA